MTMPFDELVHLRQEHPAWRLLRADNAALVLSFLGRVFVDGNAGALPAEELASQLDDDLYALNERLGAGAFPRPAAAYLDEWSSAERGWLRKYYPPGSDEPYYDLASAVEKTLLWVGELPPREFIGTESRLNTIFELLRQMVFGADDDPEVRLAELRRRRQAIDQEIAAVERGEITVLDSVAQRDRYQQFARTARELLADFREVEENFRRLDRSLREQIAGWSGSKGDLLDEALANRRSISESDQGRSFQAFYDFLLSYSRQGELTDLLERLVGIQGLDNQDSRLARIHFDWIDASERTQSTVRLLSEQLRRFLDDKVWLENRRVIDLLRSIEAQALELRHEAGPPLQVEIDDMAVTVGLPMERPLARQKSAVSLAEQQVEEGDDEVDLTSMLDQLHVDREQLARHVLTLLAHRDQVALGEVVAREPLQQGLAELIGYLSLDKAGLEVVFDEQRRERVAWSTEGIERMADLPAVTFARHVVSDADESKRP